MLLQNDVVTMRVRPNKYAPAGPGNLPRPVRLHILRADTEGFIKMSQGKPGPHTQRRMPMAQDMDGVRGVVKYPGSGVRRLPYDPEWFGGCATVNEIDKMVQDGNTDKRDRDAVIKLSRDLADPQPVDSRRVVRFADEGDEVDSDRYLAQDRDAMYRTMTPKYKRTGNKVVEISFRWGGNCGRSKQEMFTTGAVCMALANKLEELGYSVGIKAVSVVGTHDGSQEAMYMEFNLKHPGEPLNVDHMTTMACHAGVFRWYGINAIYSTDLPVDSTAGYSMYGEDADEIRKAAVATGLVDESDIELPEHFNLESARQFIENVVNQMAEAEEDFLHE